MIQPKIEILNASFHIFINEESVLADNGGLHYLPATGTEFHYNWAEVLDMMKAWHKVNSLLK